MTLLLPYWKDATYRYETCISFRGDLSSPWSLIGVIRYPNSESSQWSPWDLFIMLFYCLHGSFSIITGVVFSRAVCKGYVQTLTETCEIIAHIVCSTVTVNSSRNTKLCKYRNKSSNGFLGSVIFHLSDNYVTTEVAGNYKVAITLKIENVLPLLPMLLYNWVLDLSFLSFVCSSISDMFHI